MKLRKLVRNAVLGTVAWKLLKKKRMERRTHARHRSQASYAGGIVFVAGMVVAWLFRENIAGLFRDPDGSELYVPIADHYGPPPLSRKKQHALERREAAEKRVRDEATHKPIVVVRMEKNASPDLTVPLQDILKH